jgi:hypothetical protein
MSVGALSFVRTLVAAATCAVVGGSVCAVLMGRFYKSDPGQGQRPSRGSYRGSDGERAAAAARTHESWVARYNQEPRDATFAVSAAQTLRDELSHLEEEDDFKTVGVDCRTTMCAGHLEWSSYANVQKTAADLARHFFRLTCSKEIYVPPPAGLREPYEATVFFQCDIPK